ncbi:E3 SUMO-protein ligase ZBED1-like [Argopecten irradians]|uniref:E3 SUMO-protein ligase ZBED1-like n=1 Tax=Argopecten irradians TaxID=31199 RepID=UPI0037145555
MVRYLEQQPAITATLMSGDVRKHVKDLDTLREVDITNLEDAVSILKDMKDITTVLCDEKQPTVSLICPMKYKILKSMELGTVQPHIKTEPVEDEPQPESTPKTQPTLPTLDLMPSTSQLSSSQDSGISDTVCSGTGSTIKKNLFGDVFITGTEPANKAPLDIATGEVQSYFSEPTPPLDCNPLKWWCDNDYRYPMLSNIAKYYLIVPGTGVPSERVFSTAGDIVTSQRSCLDPEDVDKLIFLTQKNMHV